MKIADHCHMLTIPFTVPAPTGPIPRTVNVFLVCGDMVTLVDTGVAGSEGPIFSYLRDIGKSEREIGRIILTHSHPDHLGGAAAIREAAGCPVLAGGRERAWIEDAALQERERPVPGFTALVGGGVPVDRVLRDGDVVEAGNGVTLRVLETPGHSAGSLSLFIEPGGLLITADAIPLPGDMPIYDDYRQSLDSLGRLGSIQGVKLLLESWRGAADDPAERIRAGVRWLERVDAVVQRLAEAGNEPMELCRRVTAELGLPLFAANPLVARSLRSHVR